jgi:hypothetical protein
MAGFGLGRRHERTGAMIPVTESHPSLTPAQGLSPMLSLFRRSSALRLGLAAMLLAVELSAVAPPTSFAQSQAPTESVACPGSTGPADYPVSGGPSHGGGWFYTQEACRWAPIMGVGPTRARGYAVIDDDKGNFWTEFRRFGGVDVLGYPVSQPYQYPVGATGGYWYQAFERGILQAHPETGRAELANVFEQFTEADPCPQDPARADDTCLDRKLAFFGIPLPQSIGPAVTANANGELIPVEDRMIGRRDTEQRMSWLTEPRFLARYFFDPVSFHSSDPDRPGQTAFAIQEQAWEFFGLPQGTAQRMVLRAPSRPTQELWPLVHSFTAQRFQKGGLQLFMEELPPTVEQFALPLMNNDDVGRLFDPTIVPGDGKKGCVALTAVGLLARTIGIDKMIPRNKIQPLPLDPSPKPFFTTWIPAVATGQLMVQFQLDGTTFQPNEPITISLTDGLSPAVGTTPQRSLPPVTVHVDHAYSDGSFNAVVTARLGTYTITVTGDTSLSSTSKVIDLTIPTVDLNVSRTSSCRAVGLPVGN